MQFDQWFRQLNKSLHGKFFWVDSPRHIQRILAPLDVLVNVGSGYPIEDVHSLSQRLLGPVELNFGILHIGIDIQPRHLHNINQ